MLKKRIAVLCYIVVSVFSLKAQTVILEGKVRDSINIPLPYANIIATPQETNKNLKFAITDDVGYYQLSLEKDIQYQLRVSYMGYYTITTTIKVTQNSKKDFILKEADNTLGEIVIELPVTVKEDTIIYNTKKFITGEERKLKQVLKKLPGVEVLKNGSITVQGKKVTKMLVEGKKFFGGSTKLAVDNIPANAVDNIEVIDNYNEISFLKGLTDTDEMAMNIKLKKDKKRFVFGDIEAGKGNRDFYRTHANTFYYAPKLTMNFIGNINNKGEKTFTFSDYLSFQGGVSAALKEGSDFYKTSTSDFGAFMETQDVIDSQQKFGALNLTQSVSNKTAISGYAIYSHSKNTSASASYNQYTTFNELQERTGAINNKLGVLKLNVDYKPNYKEQWYFKSHVKTSKNNSANSILSSINNEESLFNTENKAQSNKFNQVIEWHKKINVKHTFSFASNYTYNKTNPTTNWTTNESILSGLIPIVESDTYNVFQNKSITTSSFENVFKHYWVLNNYNHMYTTLGYNYLDEKFKTEDYQLIDNTTINSFSIEDFDNMLAFKLTDAFVGLHYKFKIGKATFKQGVTIHNYNWNIDQDKAIKKSKTVVLPDFLAKIEFSSSKKLNIKYNLNSSFTNSSNLVNNYYLKSYNSIFQGNNSLENELYHSARIWYRRFSMYRGLMLHGGVNYSKKEKGVTNSVQFEDENQLLYAEMLNNPEENLSLNLNVSKKIKQLRYSLNTSTTFSNYKQKVDVEISNNKKNQYSYNFGAETLFEKFPVIEMGFEQSFGKYISSDTSTKFSTFKPYLNINYDFLKGFVVAFDYENYTYTNKSNSQKDNYQLANFSLLYQKEDNPWSFKIEAKNIFNIKYKQSNSFSTYIISDTKTYIQPLSVVFSIGYNL